MLKTDELLFDSAVKQFESLRAEALAVLNEMFTGKFIDEKVLNATSIKDHVVKYTKQLAEADVCLETLKKYFTEE
jgi:hypothetical protein